MDNKTWFFLALPFAAALLFVSAAYNMPIDGDFSDTEQSVLQFSSSDMEVKQRQPSKLLSGSMVPFEFYKPENAGVVSEDGELAEDIDYNDRELSLIVISGNSRMAVIDGNVVKEGDQVKDVNIVRIEQDRVLLKNKTAQWIYLEK